ncbi:MAG: hypothetical protein JWM33_3872 [Caulobacteraceae bacterium]|nr:hypothetical protein [Caulobacteraceae bacterium]
MTAASRTFTADDQAWFAAASGDRNPIHMDAGFAARNFPGQRVVHGVHALLWALDSQAGEMDLTGGIKASFIKPILLNETVQVERRGETLQLKVRDERVVILTAIPGDQDAPMPSPPGIDVLDRPKDRTGQDLSSLSGTLPSPGSIQTFASAFPRLSAVIGAPTVEAMALASTLVGMESPGLHSMLSELNLHWNDQSREGLSFETLRHDQRFNRVEMQVAGPGLQGQVAAFVGQAETLPTSHQTVAGSAPDAFAGQTPLIVGAGSGLGVATARLILAGGGEPVLAYRNLDQAAPGDLAGKAQVIAFDVTAPAPGLAALAKLGWAGGQLYYFPSPRIFRRQLEPFQAEDLADFMAIFVTGFYETVRGVLRLKAGAPLSVFYPSTVALDSSNQDLFEYRIAKSAGEGLCARLSHRHPNLTIVSSRLPRIETRQTRSFIRAKAEAPETVMLDLVHRVQGRPAP